MKSRSEIMAERKAAAKVTKSSASSRTLPIPGTDAKVWCPDCNEEMSVADLKKRDDGTYECSSCAMPLSAGTSRPKAEKKEPSKDATQPAGKVEGRKMEVETRSGQFCGTCGAEWPLLNGKRMINCSHPNALRVDDPRKATQMAGITASGVPNPPPGPPSMHAIPPNVTMSVDGDRMTGTWGKCIFPVGEAQGISKFSNMDIGPFSITETFKPENFDETFRHILANLQKMADMTFDVQFVWFKQKLGLLDK